MISFEATQKVFNENLYFENSLLKYTRIKFLPRSMRKFCIDIVKTTVEKREQNGTVRKDLMQSMIQLRNNNNIEDSHEFKVDANGKSFDSHSLHILLCARMHYLCQFN